MGASNLKGYKGPRQKFNVSEKRNEERKLLSRREVDLEAMSYFLISLGDVDFFLNNFMQFTLGKQRFLHWMGAQEVTS